MKSFDFRQNFNSMVFFGNSELDQIMIWPQNKKLFLSHMTQFSYTCSRHQASMNEKMNSYQRMRANNAYFHTEIVISCNEYVTIPWWFGG